MEFIFCLHLHQPVGNIEDILEKAYAHAYGPFLDVFEEFANIKLNLHISGYLLEWLIDRKPSYIERLKRLVKLNRVEILTGGMYEPILTMIPWRDGIGQIRMHKKLIKDVFDYDPKGMWVAERVYEPHLPLILAKAKVSYIVLDDHHFTAIGFTERELYGYYLTEFENYRIGVFAGLQYLRYAIPFKQVNEIDSYFRHVQKNAGNLLVFADDGEKFGLWPGTFDHVYKNGWIRSFFTYLSDNREWIKTTTFGEFIKNHKPSGVAYLNCNSYREMDEWCLPSKMVNDYNDLFNTSKPNLRQFIEGGYFKHFLVKYEESNDMHKKMLYVSKNQKNNKEVKRALYKAQCNDAYWHGVFGGLYLPHLRSTVYRNLIEAEILAEAKKDFPEAYLEDVNLDGFEEVILNTKNVKAYFLLREGGVLYELDYKPKKVNLVATLRRRYEAYHEKLKQAIPAEKTDGTKTIHELLLIKEVGLENLLHYDWYRRACLVDHVLGKDVSFLSFYRCEYCEPGDFVKEPYEAKIDKTEGELILTLRRDGHFWKGHAGIPLSIIKRVKFPLYQDKFIVTYEILGEVKEAFILGVEFNFSFLGSGGERYIELNKKRFPLTKMGAIEPSSIARFFDPYQEVEIFMRMEKPQEIWTHPVEVVSLSEEGFERNYQSTMFMPLWHVDLKEGVAGFQIELEINGLSHNNHV
ncbi:MAG: DUF1926 domain-containing protein [Desulfobacterota bacterium]|nr:DUF1926 domain-containing protein [Thermodesulfobacteriota bacterium]MDW8002605.1 DUF1926 domain-containing protein [Deltaproteobacteria bacterium]